MWPDTYDRAAVRESSEAYAFLVVYNGTAEEFEAATGLVIKYDLDHLL
jgi:hypothetical protein